MNVLVIDIGGNAKKLKVKVMPLGCRLGDNSFAMLGGLRQWESTIHRVADLSL